VKAAYCNGAVRDKDQVTRTFKSLLKESADTPKAKMSSEQRREKASAARKINKDRQRQLAVKLIESLTIPANVVPDSDEALALQQQKAELLGFSGGAGGSSDDSDDESYGSKGSGAASVSDSKSVSAAAAAGASTANAELMAKFRSIAQEKSSGLAAVQSSSPAQAAVKAMIEKGEKPAKKESPIAQFGPSNSPSTQVVDVRSDADGLVVVNKISGIVDTGSVVWCQRKLC